jgi:hypothetical protein
VGAAITNGAQEIDDLPNDMDSLDVEIYDFVIFPATYGLDRIVQKITQSSGREKGLGTGPVWNVEGRAGVGAGGSRMRGVMGAERVFDDSAAHSIHCGDAVFGIDEKVLPADGTANHGGGLGFLAYVHR